MEFEKRMIFHVDMDAFYASVEQLENPSYRGKPVIVGGVDSARGVVSTCSYEARVFGIHSAMPVAHARKRCPHGIYVNGRHEVYGNYSRRIMDCLSEFSPIIEQISVDEAFLDMTGTEKLFGSGETSARRLKENILKTVGLNASVGVAENKFLAKLASDHEKPNGLTVIRPGEAQAFLDPMSVGRLWGVGKKTIVDLHQAGYYTIAQLRAESLMVLERQFGENFAQHLYHLAQGKDDRELAEIETEKSISHERTFEFDTGDKEILLSALLDLSERVAQRARKHDLFGRTITLVWRNPDFSRQSHAQTLAQGTQSSEQIFAVIKMLFEKVGKIKYRLIGVRLSHFGPGNQQLSLFQSTPMPSKLDKAMDAVRERFGTDAIRRARLTGLEPEPPRD